MKKNLSTRVLAMGLMCSMAFLCACGKKAEKEAGNTAAPAAEIDKDHVYSMEDLELPIKGDFNVLSTSSSKDGVFTLIGSYSGEDSGERLFKINPESGEISEIELEHSAESDYSMLECDNKGNIYLIKNTYVVGEGGASEGDETAKDTEEVDEIIDDYSGSDDESSKMTVTATTEAGSVEDEEGVDDTEEAYSVEYGDDYDDGEYIHNLVKLTADGEKVWEAPLTEEDAEKGNVSSMVYVDGKGILSNCAGQFSLYDENTGEGKSLFTRSSGDEGDDDYYAYSVSLYRLRSGDVYLSEDNWTDNDKYKIIKFNKDTLSFDEEVMLPEGVYGHNDIFPGTTYDYLTCEDSKLEGFNVGDDKTELICDFTSSDLLLNYLNFATDTADGKLFVVSNGYDGNSEMALLTKVDPSEVVEKETLTIGTIFIPEYVRRQVVKFNKNSDKYRIKIIDYAPEDGGDNDDTYVEATNQLNLALTQGEGPDLIVVDYNMPVASYVEKGVFEPLDSYFESDDEIKLTDYLENIIEACKVKDKMYSIIPAFSVETCFASKDKVGDETVTLENYKTMCEKNGIDTQLGMGSLTASNESQLYATVGLQFIDYENGTCNFNTQGFIDLLKFINTLPKDMESVGFDYDEYDTFYRENKSLLLEYYLSSFDDYQLLKKGYFGTDIAYNGFPSVDGGDSFISPMIQVAMNSDCKNKEAAWEFLKSFLTDDYQKSVEWSFPVKLTALEALEAKAQEKPYYIDADGKKVETTSVWGVADTEVEMTELSKEETTEVMDFIKSVNKTMVYEDKIVNIISEEAAAYYEGQKTAEEVADIIQSRVSLYMSENM